MADEEQLAILRQGVEAWNAWRHEHGNFLRPGFVRSPNLTGAPLRGEELAGANLSRADLTDADLSGADLTGADLHAAYLTRARLLDGAILVDANLSDAVLMGTVLAGADLTGADLSRAHLSGAILNGTTLLRAKLSGATIGHTLLVGVDLTGATLIDCRVYGIAAWDLNLEGATQKDLVITPRGQPEITVDNFEVAQFIYLLLNNERIRHVIDTITTKAVLILGRFSEERKPILDALREVLRGQDLLPIVFDFSVPASRNVTETVKILAGLARFVIADVTDATEVRAELHNIIPGFPSLPVQPILLRGRGEFVSLLGHLAEFPWVLPTFEYASHDHLLANLDEGVIEPAEAYVRALEERRRAVEAKLAKPS
jgi:uncharacterized protein YjbI with pentapeptide repeats